MCFSFLLWNYLCSPVWKIAGAKCGGINVIVRCLCSRRIIVQMFIIVAFVPLFVPLFSHLTMNLCTEIFLKNLGIIM